MTTLQIRPMMYYCISDALHFLMMNQIPFHTDIENKILFYIGKTLLQLNHMGSLERI